MSHAALTTSCEDAPAGGFHAGVGCKGGAVGYRVGVTYFGALTTSCKDAPAGGFHAGVGCKGVAV